MSKETITKVTDKRKKRLKILFIAVGFLVAICLTGGFIGYNSIFGPNVRVPSDTMYFYIASHSSYQDVMQDIENKGFVENIQTFRLIAEKKNYPNHVKPGRYLIKDGMSNNALINLLRSGQQAPVNITFNNIRTKEQLAERVGNQIETDSTEIITLMNNNDFLNQIGFDSLTVFSMFIPNTYEVYWTITAKEFLQRMHREYQRFWTEERLQKAEKIGLTPYEVSVLASIVQAEQSQHNDEKPTVAGLYINRLKRGMPLESDPTLIYAIGDFSIRRVLSKDRAIESPFNTYKYTGLPPAPINLPEISSIDAVLNYEKHNWIFMCAKEDFSGYHYFTNSLSKHNSYARKYWKALNEKGIRR